MAVQKSAKKDLKKFTTPVFRISFPNLFEPRAVEGDSNSKPKYGCSAIWTPAKFTAREKELWRAILGELNKLSVKKFGKPWKELPDHIRRGIRDGASKEGMDGYGEGTRFANITSKNRPGVVAKDGETKIAPDEGNADEIYPGCYCRATVQVYAYSNKGKGVAIGLRNIQKVADGPRIDNRVAAEDDFDEELESKWMDQDEDIEDGDGDEAEDDFD
jgi:hypothetical protein